MPNKIHVTFSTGIGRLHFKEVVEGLIPHVKVRWILGWAPRRYPDWFSRLLSRLSGRSDFQNRLNARIINTDKKVYCPIFLPEALSVVSDRILFRLPMGKKLRDISQKLVWSLHGFLSRRHIEGSIFHVRSGAGQGGAIKRAKSMGMKVIVDHSIAHPNEIAEVLGPLYAKLGERKNTYSDSTFWRTVLKDCEEADYVLTNSDYVYKTFLTRGFKAEQLRTLYLGIRSDFLGLKSDYTRGSTVKLLFTGTFGLRKGADVILLAIKELGERGFPVELIVLGESSEGEELQKSLGIQATISYKGFVLQDELARYFRDCDIYVFPSYIEGCAKSAMEALVAGLPVIATNSSGMPDRDPRLYVKVNAGDHIGLANEIQSLGDDQQLRERLGKRGVEFGSAASWEDYSRKLTGFYNEILELDN